MIRRNVEISREPCHLSIRDEQLLIKRRNPSGRTDGTRRDDVAGRIPMEDLGVLMVDEQSTTYTHSVLTRLAEHGGALVVCGHNHLPCGMFVPLPTNTELLSRLDAQLSVSKPRQKQLWTAIVIAKIRAQASNLEHAPDIRSRLTAMSRRVRSGDPGNVEAQAARLYWPALFADLQTSSDYFRRRPGEPMAPAPNNLLDYGYAVMRAAVARALVSAGLLPAMGIQHHRRSNAFCLADDLIEPLRPIVDARVKYLALQNKMTLDQPTKAELISLVADTVRFGSETGPLAVVMHRYVASYVNALSGKAKQLEVPIATQNSEIASEKAAEFLEDECN